MATRRPVLMDDRKLATILAPLAHPERVSEGQWKEIVKALLAGYGWKWSHFPPGKTVRGKWITAGSPGFPDFMAVKGSRVIFLELKTVKGKLRPGQGPWLRCLQAVGGNVEAWVVTPAQARHLVALLAEEDDEAA